MKCLLYVPPFECEGTRTANIAAVRIGGLTLYQRACRSLQKAGFEQLLVAHPGTFTPEDDPLISMPLNFIQYEVRIGEKADEICSMMELNGEACCLVVLDGMFSPECFKMRPIGADVRIEANKELTGVYFVTANTFEELLKSGDVLNALESDISETFLAEEKTVYHRIRSSDDCKAGQNILTKSLRKPLGRDADGLVAYAINRPCSLQISKRIANSKITPNMVTGFGLILGIGAAGLMYTAIPALMVTGVILWQISSMVDGIDGELARMRMSPSHKGEWFDTVADDVTNIVFMFGLGHAMAIHSDNQIYFLIACVVCALMVIAVSWFYSEFRKMGIASHNHFEWGFEAENKENKREEKRNPIRKVLDLIAGGFAWIAKRDFYTFLIMVLVIVGLVTPAYYVMLAGASCVGVGSLFALSIRAIRSARKNKAAKKAQMIDALSKKESKIEDETPRSEDETKSGQPLASDDSAASNA